MRAKRVGVELVGLTLWPYFLEQHGEREWMRRSLERLCDVGVSHFQLVARVRQ